MCNLNNFNPAPDTYDLSNTVLAPKPVLATTYNPVVLVPVPAVLPASTYIAPAAAAAAGEASDITL